VDSGLPDMLLSSKLTCHVLHARKRNWHVLQGRSTVAPRSLHSRFMFARRSLHARVTGRRQVIELGARSMARRDGS